MTILFFFVWTCAAVYAALFYALYLCVVLLRISDAQVSVRKPGILFRQERYVECYLSLLSDHEKSLWYNVFLKHSFDIKLVLYTAFLFTVVATVVRDLR
jgi:hypothetical protein